jgi:hypothetical protein
MSVLAEMTTRFADRYHTHADLVAEQSDWHCTVVLLAADSGQRVTVRIENGRVVDVNEREEPANLVVTSDQQTLADILELRRGPNEPYLYGELTVRGAEADFVRLDYITECLCPL